MDFFSRFADKISPEPNSGCWLWLGSITVQGYARFNGRFAHRLSCEAIRGPIGAGLQIDHLCRVRCCVNPDHLEPVTARENQRRSAQARIREGLIPDRRAPSTCYCARGHDLSVVGQYPLKGQQKPRCMACSQLYRRRHYYSNRTATFRSAA